MYFITTISEKHGNRCVGYVSKLEDALSIVEENQCDLWEAGYYPYAVIEHVEEGIYQYDQDPLWFTFNEKTECYEKSNRPSFIPSNHVGFGIGQEKIMKKLWTVFQGPVPKEAIR